MVVVDNVIAWPKQKKITVSVIAAVLVATIIIAVVLIVNSGYMATTMRLLRVEGTVNIEDSNGNVKPVIDNIRFQSGDALSTGSDGLASIGLDDSKIVTLQNDSRAEFYKKGKQIELKLTQGGVFFEVTEKLADDETYEIETSNMTVGIRGTSGYVWYDETGKDSIIITDGLVKITAYNPETGETKTAEVSSGHKITCYLYSDKTDERDSIEFDLVEIKPEDLPEFPLQMLAENEALLNKVCEYTGWDKQELIDLIDAINDPETPLAPDEIIEITDTPTPTAKVNTTLTAGATSTPEATAKVTATPTPKPSNPLANIVNTLNEGAAVITDPLATPTPVLTSTPTPVPTEGAAQITTTPTPATTLMPVPTVTPESTPTTTPEATPETTPETTPKATPEVTPETTPETTPESTPEATPEPTPEATPSPEPTLPDGYSKDDKTMGWGVEFENHMVYICYSGNSYKGWYNGEWVDLEYSFIALNDGGSTSENYFLTDTDGNKIHYYRYFVDSSLKPVIVSYPDTYEPVDVAWGKTYNGKTIYVALDTENNQYMAYDQSQGRFGSWFPVERVATQDLLSGTFTIYFYYLDDNGERVDIYSWTEG